MTELHPTNDHQSMREPFPTTRRVSESVERHSIAQTSDSTPLRNRFTWNWEMIVIWGLVVFSFAALYFCLWVISAKCRGDWPY
jgi:hypothetical protein